MKKCGKCKEKYNDEFDVCPACNVKLSKVRFQKLDEFLEKHKIARYKILIVYAILAALVIGNYFIGIHTSYEDSYVAQTFQSNKEQNVAYKEQQAINEQDAETKKSLEDEITELQSTLDGINEYESKRDTFKTEIQDLSNQVNDLTAQKSQKENQLNEITAELAKY